MKKNKMMRAASALLVATLLSTSIISGTFAKYTSTASGSDTARVASWEVTYQNKASGSSEMSLTGSPQNLSVTLFDYTDNNVDTNGKGGDSKVIAPGTKGEFSFSVTSKSEVAAQTVVTLQETNKENIPIEYALKSGDTEPTTWVKADGSGNITLSMNKTFTANAATQAEKQEYTVCWRWAFAGNQSQNYTDSQTDLTDTALGIKAQTTDSAPTVTVTANITATQVD